MKTPLRPPIRYAQSFDDAEEVQAFPYGSGMTVRLGDLVIGKIVCNPGWHWAEQIKPIAGTDSCQFHHVGVGLSGELRFRMDDGTEFSVTAGDVFDIPAGHDVWVVGDEPSVLVIWGGWRGFGKSPTGNRILTTLLFTDIAGSTAHAARVGDAAWDRLMERHNSLIREALEEFGGTEIDTTGDGFLATFNGAGRAVLAAVAMREELEAIGLNIRVAVHTGEVELVPGNVRGLAVHEAARILALASAGDILVSSTTYELSSGAGLAFTDRGLHELKGVPAPRRVFAFEPNPPA